MMHPHTELRHVNPVIGHGVFATRFIPRGTVTWVRDELDIAFPPGETARLHSLFHETLEKYTFIDDDGLLVLCWDHARYVNHSCEANCLSNGEGFELAVRDIAAGEELTDDYTALHLTEGFRCACGSPRCRKQVLPQPTEQLRQKWDRLVRDALHEINRVPQPLGPLLRREDSSGSRLPQLKVEG